MQKELLDNLISSLEEKVDTSKVKVSQDNYKITNQDYLQKDNSKDVRKGAILNVCI